jgi:hypothetical protein
VPYPIESKGFDDGWVVISFTDSGSTVSLVVLEDGEWFNRYEFDKVTRRWRTTRYGWVSTEDVPVFERPDDRSPRIDLLRLGLHFGNQGHDHFGHPIVVLDDIAGWERVITCRNVVGWIRTGILADTLSFVRAVLRNPATARDFGNEGPRMFLARVHLSFDVILDYLWGHPTEVLLAALTVHEIKAESRTIRLVEIGEMAGPTISLSAAALRSSGLEVYGSGGGSIPHTAIFDAFPKLWALAADGALRIDTERVALADVETAWLRPHPPGRRVVIIP